MGFGRTSVSEDHFETVNCQELDGAGLSDMCDEFAIQRVYR